ncbi:hypothetical protein JTB14_004452 [Gonioctena quinquepunctata]|nr:hypothetical protein JTB14_004452 [Gonioctena quinquepunctata]
MNGFKSTGLYPMDGNVFKEEDFTPISDSPTAREDNIMYTPALVVDASPSPVASQSPVAGPNPVVGLSGLTSINKHTDDELPQEMQEMYEATDDENKAIQIKNKSFEEIYPTPKPKPRQSKRKEQKWEILTSTPMKGELEETNKKTTEISCYCKETRTL